MKKIFYISVTLFMTGLCSLHGQNAIQIGSGSYAEYPPEAVLDIDGFFTNETPIR